MTSSSFCLRMEGDARHMVNFFHVFQILPCFRLNSFLCHTKKMYTCNIACVPTNLDIWVTHNFSLQCFFLFVILSPYPTHQKQSTTRPTHSLHTKSCKVAATKSRKVAATKSCKVAATRSCKVAATKSRKNAATKSRKVAATKSSKINLHTKNSQAATSCSN